MSQITPLRVISLASIGFALVFSILTLTTRFSPAAPAYLTFLFTGLVGNFAAHSLKDLERRLNAVEQRGRS